jgi:PIN domain nuclease of toxin-antitoxin system
VKYLLDTHALLWSANDDPRLSRSARDAILHDDSVLTVSVVSAWELSIKAGTGKLRLEPSVVAWFTQATQLGRIQVLGVDLDHLTGLEELPRHHGDPFDRLLICQARPLGLTIITRDRAFTRYDVATLW